MLPSNEEIRKQAESNLLEIVPVISAMRPWDAIAFALKAKQCNHSKFQVLQQVGQVISQIAAPKTACRQNCNYCCYQSVSVSQIEAEAISNLLQRSYTYPQKSSVYADREKYLGVPCCFLKNGKCSVYEERPIVCRTHINMSNSAEVCIVGNKNSPNVPYLNTEFLNPAIAVICGQDFHDIRDWFPEEKS